MDARSLLRIARVFRAVAHLLVVAVDLPIQLLTLRLEAAEIVLAVGVVLLGEGVEGPDPLERLGDEAGALVMDAAGDDSAPALSAGAEGGLFAKKLASIEAASFDVKNMRVLRYHRC